MAEKEPTQEPMQLDVGAGEGAEPTATGNEVDQVDIDALVQTLDKIGVKDAQHLEGIYNTAQAHGPTAQELGQSRQLIAQLQQENAQLRQSATRQPQQQQPLVDEYGQPIPQPGMTREDAKQAMREVLMNELLLPQQQHQQRLLQEQATIQNNDYYGLVEEDLRVHLDNPTVRAEMAAGRTTLSNEFNKLVGKKLTEVGMNLKKAIQQIKGEAPAGKTPHMESGQTPPPVTPRGEGEKQERLAEIQKKATGSDGDIDAILDAIVPKGRDPFFD